MNSVWAGCDHRYLASVKCVVTILVEGPAWSSRGLPPVAGRFPLSVESHVLNMVDRLVPGVTTVTPHARYYAVHALVAHEVVRRGLSVMGTQELLRRVEVALAVVSAFHDHKVRLPKAHGQDALAGASPVVLAEAAEPGRDGYSSSPWGFWKPYSASERTLRILDKGSSLTPGPRSDEAALRASLGPLLEMAAQEEIGDEAAELSGRLCLCTADEAPDGRWLSSILCGLGEEPTPHDHDRRETIRLLARVLSTHQVESLTTDFTEAVAFGEFGVTDELAASLSITSAWQGLLLRNYVVGAWRRLWAWLVNQVDSFMPAEELGDRFAAEMPDQTVGAFVDGLPSSINGNGHAAPVEPALRRGDWPSPRTELAILAIGARRTKELEGDSLRAFIGSERIRDRELSPLWMCRRLQEHRSQHLRDFARELVEILLARAQRVALAKSQRRDDGSLWVPSRVRSRDGHLFAVGTEGSGDVGLRIDQLGSVLVGAGVLTNATGQWKVTERGWALLA